MPAAAIHNLLGTSAKQFSVKSVLTSINPVSNWLSLPIDKKSPCQVTLQEKCLFICLLWCKSRIIRAHNKLSEAEKFRKSFTLP